jgi:hypothetical protein
MRRDTLMRVTKEVLLDITGKWRAADLYCNITISVTH